MEAITVYQIAAECKLKISHIHTIQFMHKVNEHGVLQLQCTLVEPPPAAFLRKPPQNRNIVLSAKSGDDTLNLFAGKICEMQCSVDHDTIRAELMCKTSSILLDLVEESHAFLDTSQTYSGVLGDAVGDRGDVYIFLGDRPISNPVIQYRETAWQFIKRMAGHFQAMVIVQAASSTPHIGIGAPKVEGKTLDASATPTLILDARRNALTYAFSSVENYELGEKLIITDKAGYVVKKEAHLEGGVLTFLYHLADKLQDVGVMRHTNPQLRGVSLPGTVYSARNERVRVSLELEHNRKKKNNVSFPYVPASGNAMYSMPEKGAKIRLCFPDGEETNGIVNAAELFEAEKPRNHKVKGICTPDKKLLELLPKALVFSAANGRAKNNLSITDHVTASFSGSKKVTLRAGGRLLLSSGALSYWISGTQTSFLHPASSSGLTMGCGVLNYCAKSIQSSARTHRSQKEYDAYVALAQKQQVEVGDSALNAAGGIPDASAGAVAALTGAVPTVGNASMPLSMHKNEGVFLK